MAKSSRIPRNRRSGQSMVEFALLVPVFMLLVLGLVDTARVVYYYNVISSSAREGAREAVLAYDQCSNTSDSACGSGPQSGNSLVGVDNAAARGGAGIVPYNFVTDVVGTQNVRPTCSPQANRGCGWVFIVNPSTSGTSPCTPPGPNDAWSSCDFSAKKTGGNHDVVVEIEYKFVPLTPLVANVMGNSLTLWAKSEMRTEY